MRSKFEICEGSSNFINNSWITGDVVSFSDNDNIYLYCQFVPSTTSIFIVYVSVYSDKKTSVSFWLTEKKTYCKKLGKKSILTKRDTISIYFLII